MKASNSEVETNYVVEINGVDRWQMYQRLQELEIPCWCEANQPLKVEIVSPGTVVQVWSVMRQFTSSRQDLINCLKISWQTRYRKPQ